MYTSQVYITVRTEPKVRKCLVPFAKVNLHFIHVHDTLILLNPIINSIHDLFCNCNNFPVFSKKNAIWINISMLVYLLTINMENALVFRKHELRGRHITMTLTNHKQRFSLLLVSDGMSQNILSQTFDVIQSDVANVLEFFIKSAAKMVEHA